MTRTFLLTLTVGASVWAQPALAPPRIGFIEDGAGAVRPLYGIAGNFILGNAAKKGPVVSFASSGSSALIKTDSSVTVLGPLGRVTGITAAATGPALFAFSLDGTPSLAYVVASNELLHWSGNGFEPAASPEALPGEVVSIASPDAQHAALIVRQSEVLLDVRVSLATGEVSSQAALAGVTAPALMLPSGDIVYTASFRRGRLLIQSIVIRRTDGSEIQLPADLPAAFSLIQMGAGWVQLHGAGAGTQFAIRTTAGHESIHQLPEAEQ